MTSDALLLWSDALLLWLTSEARLPWLVAASLLVLFVLLSVVRSARFKGFLGELRVKVATGLRLNGRTYRSLHNLTLPTEDGTTQIDHVIVSEFGVFVIETKNLTGWIFGNERSRKWTQSLHRNSRFQFQNPLRQNHGHVKVVEKLLGLGPRCLHSVVVFVGKSEFKTTMPPNVLTRRELIRHIKSKTEVLLSDEQVEASIRKLERSRISKFGTRRRHIRGLRERHAEN